MKNTLSISHLYSGNFPHFLSENRLCYVESRDQVENANEIQGDTKILNDPDNFDLDQLNKDAEIVEQALQQKIDWWLPLGWSMVGHDSVFEGTSGAKNEGVRNFLKRFGWKISVLSDSSQREYQRLVKSELILEEVIRNLEKEKQAVLDRKQKILDAMDDLQRMKFFPSPFASYQRMKIQGNEMKGAEKQKEILVDKKEKITAKRKKYEKAILDKLAPHADMRKNLINFFELGWFETEDAEKILEAITSGDLKVKKKSDKILVGRIEPYLSMIPDEFWNQLWKTERKVLGKILNEFEADKNQETIQDFNLQKHNIEKLREYKDQSLEYTKNKKGDEVKLPAVKIDKQTFEPGKYLVVKQSGGKNYYLRIDESSNVQNDLKKDLIVLDHSKWGWEFAWTNSKTQVASGWAITKSIHDQIEKSKKLENIKAGIEQRVTDLKNNLGKYTRIANLKQDLQNQITDYESFLTFLGADNKLKIAPNLVKDLNHLKTS